MNIITVYTIKDYILLSNIPSKGAGSPLVRASDISRGRGPAKFRYFREIPRNSPEIVPNTCRQNIFNTYLGYYTGFIHTKRPNLA